MEALSRTDRRDRVAVAGPQSAVTYGQIDDAARRIARRLMGASGCDLDGSRVALALPPGSEWIAALFGIWRAGGIAVPLALSHPPGEIAFVLADAGVSAVVGDEVSAGAISPLAAAAGAAFVDVTEGADGSQLFHADSTLRHDSRRAMIVYTSGTTGRPKGVVTTHGNIAAQVASLLEAWEWTDRDRTLLVLPLHHVHGIVNVVLSALEAGAAIEMPPRFDASVVWERLASGEITVFTAVPTIYHRLIAHWDAAPRDVQMRWSAGVRRLRLMMSGSAALPMTVLERWREVSGHTLLERYGMTEIGMGLANPLHGERRPGFVGVPLPGVRARIVDEQAREVTAGNPGELEISGGAVFLEYWRRPEETISAFRDGWFRTGDVAVIESGAFRLLGRSSTDILKTGGHKISALEIEEVMRRHPGISDCAVVGLKDDEWGERVAIAIEPRAGAEIRLEDLQGFARPFLANYKLPRAIRCVAALPRNAMGKIVKPQVAVLFDREGS